MRRLVIRGQELVNRALAPVDLAVIRRSGMGHDVLLNVRRILDGNSPRVVFDVGANTGQTLKRVRSEFPTAYIRCFEPSPSVYAELCRTAEGDDLAKCYCAALSETDGDATFFEFPVSTANSLLAPNVVEDSPEWLRQAKETRVPTRRLDAVCAAESIPHIDLLKIDTQGFDLGVLRGAQALLEKKAITLIYLEVCFAKHYHQQCWFDEIYSFLRERGYRFVDFYEKVWDVDFSMIYCNALFRS